MLCEDGSMSDPSDVVDNEAAGRFELTVDGHLASLVYRRAGDRLILIHTGVPEDLSGKGIGGILVTAAIERGARDGLTVVPLCPFALDWLNRHRDAAAMVKIEMPGEEG
jgi:predicted GNAT family acetyltransferase